MRKILPLRAWLAAGLILGSPFSHAASQLSGSPLSPVQPNSMASCSPAWARLMYSPHS